MTRHRFPADLPSPADERPLLTWLDRDRAPLFRLLKLTDEHEVRILEENLPGLRPAGNVVALPGTGAQVYAGYDAVLPDAYGITVGVWAGTHPGAQTLMDQVTDAAIRTRYVQEGALVRPVTRFTGIERGWRGAAALGATVKAVFALASAYRFRAPRSRAVPVGAAQTLPIQGRAPCDLRVEITAGSTPVVNPTIDGALGRTLWAGTIPAGQTLVIDELEGAGVCDLGGLDRSTSLYGPQPQLTPEQPGITITAPGATARVTWQEGVF
ncbi:hypothetical protein [Deinococcus sp. NW-56]|uniref:hypothetical protein n=1 Tax=Deinococcus sp. NW-56 TaxID=2080419 RepID=UPI000CF4FFB2|nr:hypothetical protein [Deinococcus sp. NW-56]